MESVEPIEVYPMNAWGQARRNFWREVSRDYELESYKVEEEIEDMLYELDGVKVIRN